MHLTPDRVAGTARISMKVNKNEKDSPWITLEGSFDLNCDENSVEGWKAKRAEGWEELQEDLQNQLTEFIKSMKELDA